MSFQVAMAGALCWVLLLAVPGCAAACAPSSSLPAALCWGRCTAASMALGLDWATCLYKCCSVGVWRSNASSQYPDGCPLQSYSACPPPEAIVNAPQLSVENGRVILNLSSSTLELGVPLCPPQHQNVSTCIANCSSNSSEVIVIRLIHLVSLNVRYQLMYAGRLNDIRINKTECHNVSIAVINECGMSAFSPPKVFPPEGSLNIKTVVVKRSWLLDSTPRIEVRWQYEDSSYVPAEPNASIAFEVDGNRNPQWCSNAYKAVQTIQPQAVFLAQDFPNNIFWLCEYKVLVTVKSTCVLAQKKIKNPRLLPGHIEVTGKEIRWNPQNHSYSVFLVWQVPNIPRVLEEITRFVISFSNVNIIRKPIIVYPIPDKTTYNLSIGIDIKSRECRDWPRIGIIPHFTFTNGSGMQGFVGCLDAHPPGAVLNMTLARNGSWLRLSWEEPPSLSAPIERYTVEVVEFGRGGGKVNGPLCFDRNVTHYLRDIPRLQDLVTHVTFNVSAVSLFGASPIVSCRYENPATTDPVSTGKPASAVPVAVTLSPSIAVALVFVAAVVAIFAVVCKRCKMSHRTNRTITGVLAAKIDHKADSYQMYFKRLPPAMVDRWVVPLHMFNFESFHLLGEGNFSSVYFCTVQGPLSTHTQLEQFKKYSEEPVAVKLLKGNSAEQEMEAFLNEAEVLKTLSSQSCPYVVQLVGLQLEHAPPMIAMELVACGNLASVLKSSYLADEDDDTKSLVAAISSKHSSNLAQIKQQTLVQFKKERDKSIDSYLQLKMHSNSDRDSVAFAVESPNIGVKASQLFKFIIQAIRGMEHLQTFGILHRDLACRNLLLSASGIVKISDFGFACFLNGQSQVVSQLPTDSKPLRWMSPEAFEQDTFSESSDVWGFGVTLWEIFNQGKFPYPTLSDGDIMEAVKSGQFLECPEKCDEKVYNLMLNCWMLAPHDRPTFSSLKTAFEGFMYDLYPYMLMEH